MALYFNGVAVTSVTFNGTLLTQFNVNGVNVLSAPTGFVYSYDGTTTTVLNERYLVDSISVENVLLKTNTGIKLDGSSQAINTGWIPDLSSTQDYTVIARFDTSAPSGSQNRTVFGTQENDFTRAFLLTRHFTQNALRLNMGNATFDTAFGTGIEEVAFTKEATKLTAYRESGVFTYNAVIPVDQPVLPMYVGVRNKGGVLDGFNDGDMDYIYVIPKLMSQTDIEAAQANIERLLYLDNLGNLASDYIDQPTLDLMVLGNGMAFSFSENASCNGQVYDLATKTTKTITNWSASVHSNYTPNGGYQNALITQDANGSHTGLATIDVEADTFLDAQTQFTDENGLTLTDNAGQWEIAK